MVRRKNILSPEFGLMLLAAGLGRFLMIFKYDIRFWFTQTSHVSSMKVAKSSLQVANSPFYP